MQWQPQGTTRVRSSEASDVYKGQVLIAAEMLAQNPGLGKFVWDEFQSGGSASLARIMVAVITIGLIGCALDRGMLALQQWLSWDKRQVLR